MSLVRIIAPSALILSECSSPKHQAILHFLAHAFFTLLKDLFIDNGEASHIELAFIAATHSRLAQLLIKPTYLVNDKTLKIPLGMSFSDSPNCRILPLRVRVL